MEDFAALLRVCQLWCQDSTTEVLPRFDQDMEQPDKWDVEIVFLPADAISYSALLASGELMSFKTAANHIAGIDVSIEVSKPADIE